MAYVYRKCVVLACMLASLSLPALCQTDEAASTEVPESTSAEVTTTAMMHDEMDDDRVGRGTEPEEESSDETDCEAICSRRWSEDDKERGQKSGGRKPNSGSKGEGRGRNSTEKHPQRNGSYKIETFKGTWQRGENGTWNGTFEREVVEGKWHRHNGTWNGTFEREGVRGEWERSENGTFNKSFERESGNGTWRRSPNGTWHSQYEDADEKRHEGKGKPRCDCRKRGGAETELETARTEEMETRSGGSDANRGIRGGNSEADEIVRSGSDRSDGSDGLGNGIPVTAFEDELKPQTEVITNSSSSNDQKTGGEGFGNATVLGLAGVGIAAFCVAFGLLCVFRRRNGKAPLTTSEAVPGKSIDNAVSSDPGVVAGVVVNTV